MFNFDNTSEGYIIKAWKALVCIFQENKTLKDSASTL